MVDWIAHYMCTVEDYPVLSQVAPGDVRAALPDSPPAHGEPFDAIFADLERVIMPGITHWQSPNFFGYFPANASGPAILGELLSAGLGVQGMLWTTSPACTELETHVLDWLVGALGLPERFNSHTAGGGVIQDTASSATLCALIAARERATGLKSNAEGVRQPLVAYASDQTHSSMEKACRIAGLGDQNLRLIPTDQARAMRPDALAEAIASDLSSGHRPCFVCATIGTTSSGAIDPLEPLGDICRRHGLWLHVDAAMSGSAAICPEFRDMHIGLEQADSYCFNPHKWLLVNFDCDCFYVADRASLIRSLSVLPEYLRNEATASGAVFDYRDWHIPLGRRFRALKLWFVMRYYGIEGLRTHIRQTVELARHFADAVNADADYEVVAPQHLNLVCFRHRGGNDINQRILDRTNAAGRLFLTHTRLEDRLTLRLAVGQPHTTREHIDRAWDHLRHAGRQP